MSKRRVVKPDDFTVLLKLIEAYKDAAVEASWAGGGNPADILVIENELNAAREQMAAHVEKINREYQKV